MSNRFKDFLKDYKAIHKQSNMWFEDKEGKTYKAYKCRGCNCYTPHKFFVLINETAWYNCLLCDEQKAIYVGLRKLPERGMM